MHEMLGNHYFLARDYSRASELLEKALLGDHKNKFIQRKLIICLSQTGKIEKALKIFLSLIKEDIDFVINTDPIDDDCPCPELVFEMEKSLENNENSLDFILILGMLWLYCNPGKSLEYFKTAVDLDQQNSDIKSILALLNVRLESHSENIPG